jgi:hypothetical protein
MKSLTLIISFLAFNFLGAQSIQDAQRFDTLVTNQVERLQAQKIDTIFVYHRMIDLKFSDPVYFFWQKNGNYFISKSDMKTAYLPSQIDLQNEFKFFIEHEEAIEDEEPKKFTFLNESKKLMVGETERDNFTTIKLLKGNDEISKKFTDHEFMEKDGNKLNINYNYNAGLKSAQLRTNLAKRIEESENKKLFKKLK